MNDNSDNWTGSAEPIKQSSTTQTAPGWERDALENIALAGLKEQRRGRRWNIFFKCLFALYLFSFLAIYFGGQMELGSLGGGKHTALVDINGVISMDSEANADYIGSGLRAAFKDENTAGVILRINSPGGSPVQSGYINDEINRLRSEYPDIPVYAAEPIDFIGDIA